MSNVCRCPKPPGGSITCNNDQLAVCGYQEGEVVGGCYDKPQSLEFITNEDERNLATANWSLGLITGTPRSDYDPIDSDSFGILRSGSYRSESTGEVVTFVLPRDLDLKSAAKLSTAVR